MVTLAKAVSKYRLENGYSNLKLRLDIAEIFDGINWGEVK